MVPLGLSAISGVNEEAQIVFEHPLVGQWVYKAVASPESMLSGAQMVTNMDQKNIHFGMHILRQIRWFKTYGCVLYTLRILF